MAGMKILLQWGLSCSIWKDFSFGHPSSLCYCAFVVGYRKGERGRICQVGCRMVRCNCYFPDCFGSPVSIKRVFHGSRMLLYILRAGILI